MGLSMAICGVCWILVNVHGKCTTPVAIPSNVKDEGVEVDAANDINHNGPVSEKHHYITKL